MLVRSGSPSKKKSEELQLENELWGLLRAEHQRLDREFKARNRPSAPEDGSLIFANIQRLIHHLGRLKERLNLDPETFKKADLSTCLNVVRWSYELWDIFQKIKLLFPTFFNESAEEEDSLAGTFSAELSKVTAKQGKFVDTMVLQYSAKEKEKLNESITLAIGFKRGIETLNGLYEEAFCMKLINVINNVDYWQSTLLFSSLRWDAAPAGVKAMRDLAEGFEREHKAAEKQADNQGEWHADVEKRTAFIQRIRGIAEARLNERFCCFFRPLGRDSHTSEFYTFLASLDAGALSLENARVAARVDAIKSEGQEELTTERGLPYVS